MNRPITVEEYFRVPGRSPEFDLTFGFIRPVRVHPPAHAQAIERVVQALNAHLDARHLPGIVIPGPTPVVLSTEESLILHPAAAVLLHERRAFLRGQIWGAPSIVIDVISEATARRTRCTKVRWYREHGVQEYWLVDMRSRRIEVFEFVNGSSLPFIFSNHASVRSELLPDFRLDVSKVFL